MKIIVRKDVNQVDFLPSNKAQGLNVDSLDSVFTGMDIGQRTGWWLPDDGSWKAYKEIKTMFGKLGVSLVGVE